MKLEGTKIGVVFTGSFCTFKNVITQIQNIIKHGAEVIPIMSFNSYNLDTRFNKASDLVEKVEKITNKKIINSIQDAENLGLKQELDIMIVAPASRKYYC